MKQKILLSLIALFSLFALGAFVANLNVTNTTSTFNRLIALHQIEDLRRGLLEKILKAQSDLYVVNTPLGKDLNLIIENVFSLEASARGCLACHHNPQVTAALETTKDLIHDYQEALSFYITASANKERIEALKREASLIGNRIITNTDRMILTANKKIKLMTRQTLAKVEAARRTLLYTLSAAFLFGVLISVYLVRSMTVPVRDLVAATRRIAAGELGYRLPTAYKAEFGELADHLNMMSLALRENYTSLKEEIAERRQTEEALLESRERFALAARAANDGLWDWNLKTDVFYLSPRWKLLLGFAEDEVGNGFEEWLALVHSEDRNQLQTKIYAHIDGHTRHFEDEYRIRHKDGSYRWMLCKGVAVRDLSGNAYRIAGSQTDITEQRAAQEQLLHDAFHDGLTDLPNRALFMNRLKHAINTAQRHPDYLYAVLFLDLDRFKVINDSLGHLAGDKLLLVVSQRLLDFLRPTDTVARLGGDEFAILLEDIRDYGDAITIAQRIITELPLPILIAGQETFTTASIGIAFSSEDYERPEQLLRDADLAMYQAKANGKARYEIFHQAMHQETIQRLRMETELRRGIENHELCVHYQPIYSLRAKRTTGFEALVRWSPPGRELVPPDDFISLAEETGLITDIGDWIISAACSNASRWAKKFPTDFPLTVNVNLSSREFVPGLCEKIMTTLSLSGIDPSVVRLELTESTIMADPELAAHLLRQLKAMGVGLLIDDFGTGYSSLSHLQRFPFDVLKIDRSFVKDVHLEREKLEIVKTIIDLAHNLKMTVVAEGVETAAEFNLLAELGCEYVQGFFIAEPLDADALDSYIQTEAMQQRPLRLEVRQ